MKILDIDKKIYRDRLTKVIIGFIAALTVLSILFGSALISLFVEQSINVVGLAEGSAKASHFKFNFLGVVLALLSCAAMLHRLKNTTFFYEIYYVWQLKQLHNLIYRKLTKIKKAVFDENNLNAMVILNFYYISLKQVYFLDDNTLTMSKVTADQEKLTKKLIEENLTLPLEDFNKHMLKDL